jgi:hypothetical protein
VSRFQFVADHRNTFEVKRLCEVVDIARSSFYAWADAAAARAAKQAADEALEARIRVVHDADSTCGAPRITAELNDGAPQEKRVNRKRVARVMRAAGIAGYRRKRRVKTTVADPAAQKVPDLLHRDFTAATPNTKYVGDIKCRRRQFMSPTHLRFGSAAVKSRLSRSGNFGAALSCLVSPLRRLIRRATKPCRRIESATVFSDTSHPRSRRSAISRGEPCSPLAALNAAATTVSSCARRRSVSVYSPSAVSARAIHL